MLSGKPVPDSTVCCFGRGGTPELAIKGQTGNILGFVSQMVPMVTNQLCCGSMKAAMGNDM